MLKPLSFLLKRNGGRRAATRPTAKAWLPRWLLGDMVDFAWRSVVELVEHRRERVTACPRRHFQRRALYQSLALCE